MLRGDPLLSSAILSFSDNSDETNDEYVGRVETSTKHLSEYNEPLSPEVNSEESSTDILQGIFFLNFKVIYL